LREAVAESVVGVGRSLPSADGEESVGGIVEIGIYSVIEEIAVIVPRVSDAVYARESVDNIILITVHCRLRRFG
jgi:hypothetical protein